MTSIWTFETLITKAVPFYRGYYRDVKKVEKLDERTVRFTFGGGTNRELPLILGQLVVLPKHYWAERDFTRTTLEPPLGSGSYKIGAFEPGRHVEYQGVEDYWGRDLPVNVGRDNFDRIRHDYYRDGTVSVEAFKAGEYDFRDENSSKNWATAYDFPALRQGLVKKEEIPHDRSTGMQGFAFNSRQPLFQDRKVREALAYAFDFEWSNRTLFYGQYARTRSYFDNSELAAAGLPSPAERAILEPYRGRLPEEVFTKAYEPPVNDGSGRIRANLRQGSKLLREAGWNVDKTTRKLTHKATGRTMEFEVLLVSPLFERIVLPFKKNLAQLGITATVRTVDSAQYRRRLDDFDFDVVIGTWGQSLSAGKRATELLGLGLRRPARQPEPGGPQGPGGRCAGDGRDQGSRPQEPGEPRARPGPRAPVGPLGHPPVAHPLRPAGVLGPVRPPRGHTHPGSPVRRLVDRRREGGSPGDRRRKGG